jgi:hypothetical protein
MGWQAEAAVLRRFCGRESRRRPPAAANSRQPPCCLCVQDVRAPFLDPFLRTFFLALGFSTLFEGGHVALQVCSAGFCGRAGHVAGHMV